jgi:peptidoglycan-N-acetylglucosamine deacetylase
LSLSKLHKVVVTTSWDDGHPQDLRLAELLHKKGLSGTFYVPLHHEGHRVMLDSEMKVIRSAGFEIGGHTVSHATLTSLDVKEIAEEVRGCKSHLENILGERIDSFCYPRGRYDSRVKKELVAAGYLGARTTRMLYTDSSFERFAMPTSVQAYPHRTVTYLKNLLRARNAGGLFNLMFEFGCPGKWFELGRKLFDWTVAYGGVWHLYGHSWEIDELGLWNELSDLLDYVGGRELVSYEANGALWSSSTLPG